MRKVGVSALSSVVREDLPEQVAFEEGPEGHAEVSQVGIGGRAAAAAERIAGPESGTGPAGGRCGHSRMSVWLLTQGGSGWRVLDRGVT